MNVFKTNILIAGRAPPNEYRFSLYNQQELSEATPVERARIIARRNAYHERINEDRARMERANQQKVKKDKAEKEKAEKEKVEKGRVKKERAKMAAAEARHQALAKALSITFDDLDLADISDVECGMTSEVSECADPISDLLKRDLAVSVEANKQKDAEIHRLRDTVREQNRDIRRMAKVEEDYMLEGWELVGDE